MNEDELEAFPLRTELDVAILMHRDIHFGGSFSVMLEYYSGDNKGIQRDFSIEKIEQLAAFERSVEENLASILLSGAEAETVQRARESYQTLRDLYEKEGVIDRIPRLIADLILTEDSDASDEIAAIVEEGEKVVPALIRLMRSEEFWDPLFPGYGQGPILAAKCLGRIGDDRALPPLFELLRNCDFFEEEVVKEALKAFGESTKQFLLNLLQSKPLNVDNELAAVMLFDFMEDPTVSSVVLDLLSDPEVLKCAALADHLALMGEGLVDPEERKKYEDLAKSEKIPPSTIKEMQMIINSWK